MSIVSFILETCDTNIETVLRCLEKSTFIYYDSEVCLLADDKIIYYFSKRSNVPTKKAYIVAHKYKNIMQGKYFYSKNVNMFKNHCRIVSSLETPDGKKYLWTF